ncbi:50S ribosomal protein L35 [Candidatus Falkowbacteria bacterium]|nr:50S ribosomal protein L35 [Candidatus Falkowbacteria bacterium]
MSKGQKTHKSIVKRYKVTKTGKVMKRKAGQGHFNARESGNITRMKRKTTTQAKPFVKTIGSYIAN